MRAKPLSRILQSKLHEAAASALAVAGFLSAVTGCGRSSLPDLGILPEEANDPAGPDLQTLCGATREVADFDCTRREDGPCSRWMLVQPECGEDDEWACPAGTDVLQTDAAGSDVCLPFSSDAHPFDSLASSGIPAERGDGRCMWIMNDARTHSGEWLSHPAALVPAHPAGGACEGGVQLLGDAEPYSVVDATEAGRDALVSLGDGFRWRDETWFYYRHWLPDSNGAFGVRLNGTRVARYDESNESVVFESGFLWGPELAYGDAALVVDGVPHVFGCHGEPQFLSYNCHLARLQGDDINSSESYEYFIGDGGWGKDIRKEVPVFDSGPHRSAVRFHPGLDRYIMLFAYGFGDTIHMRTATAPQGPWSEPAVVGPCDLPKDDPEAFCATPALHLELMADWRPDELVVSYDVGTTAADQDERRRRDRLAYWPRLARLALP